MGKRSGQGKVEWKGGNLTTTKPMIVHLPAITFDVVIFWFALRDLEGFARDDYVGGARAAGPFLAVEAVASVRGG